MLLERVASIRTSIALLPITYLTIILSGGSLVASLAIDTKTSNQIQTVEQKSIQQKQQSSNHEIRADLRRPVWNIAHMVNSIKELDYRLSKGANGIEVDVTFSREGVPLYTYHGPPCDCWRHCHQQEDFNEYLRYVHEIAIEDSDGLGKNMTLLFLDLKLDYLDQSSKTRAGIELAKSIVSNLFLDSDASRLALDESAKSRSQSDQEDIRTETKVPNDQLKLILSVNHINDLELINNFLHYLDEHNSSHLMSRIGFDVGMNDAIQSIESMWRRFGNSLNLWQGDGFTNCFSPFYNLERLTRALSKRDDPSGYPRKVYQWTIDLHDRMRDALRLGVDAVMTNHPERMLTILKEPDIAHHFRLATHEDDPFKKLTQRAQGRNGESARYQRSASSTGGGFLSNLIDVVQSWWAYMREIPFLSFPVTTRLTPKTKHHRQASREMVKASEAEYRVDISSTASTESTASIATSAECNCTTNSTESSLSESLVAKTVGKNDSLPYEPKWYTSLASNLLLSALKLVMPVETY